MSKHENDLHDKAEKTNQRINLPAPVDRPVTELLPVKRLSPVPGRVDRTGLGIIIRAVTLHLARSADLDDDSLEKTGNALVEISRFYIRHERSHPDDSENPPREGNQGAS